MKTSITVDTLLRLKEFYFLIYIFLINVYSFSITGIDKYKAKKEKWRIKEKTFFIAALFGGACGVMMGMTMFRHKTKHKTFYIGIPIIYMINIICTFLLIYFIFVK